ncbi:MAG TPA: FeoA family protein [Candidatus Ratteibacteria bacterium]|nr:FeoA family protein [Candidatus Ratteibacteria bacterium]
MIKLSDTKEGIYKIVNIEKCGKGKLKKLYNLGIFVGDMIEVIKPGPGPVIIKKGNTRIGIGTGIANDIIVEPID